MPPIPWTDDAWYQAVLSNDVPTVLAMLNAGWPVDRPVVEKFPAGRSALSLALRHEDLTMAHALLDAGASVQHRDAMLITPLMDACFWSTSTAMVERLIAAGSDVNAVSRKGRTPLHFAAGQGFAEKVDRLLLAGAFAFAQTPEGDTPMSMAMGPKVRHVDVIDRLHMSQVRALQEATDGLGTTTARRPRL